MLLSQGLEESGPRSLTVTKFVSFWLFSLEQVTSFLWVCFFSCEVGVSPLCCLCS